MSARWVDPVGGAWRPSVGRDVFALLFIGVVAVAMVVAVVRVSDPSPPDGYVPSKATVVSGPQDPETVSLFEVGTPGGLWACVSVEQVGVWCDTGTGMCHVFDGEDLGRC